MQGGRYEPIGAVARKVGLNPRAAAQLTGPVWVAPTPDCGRFDRIDLGLNLKSAAKGLCVADYSRPGKDGNGWEFSQLTVKLIQEYKKLHPWVFHALMADPDNGFEGLELDAALAHVPEGTALRVSQIQRQTVSSPSLTSTSFMQRKYGNTSNVYQYSRLLRLYHIRTVRPDYSKCPVRPDYCTQSPIQYTHTQVSRLILSAFIVSGDRLEVLKNTKAWLKGTEAAKKPLVSKFSKVAAEAAIKALHATLGGPSTKTVLPTVLEAVTPLLLMRPVRDGETLDLYAGGDFSLGDRVAMVGDGGSPSFGTRGYVVAVHGEACEILFDHEFVGGNDLHGVLPDKRGAMLPSSQLVNLSHPVRPSRAFPKSRTTVCPDCLSIHRDILVMRRDVLPLP